MRVLDSFYFHPFVALEFLITLFHLCDHPGNLAFK